MIKEKMKRTRKKQFCLNWIPCVLGDESSPHLLRNTVHPLLFLQRRGVSKKRLLISKDRSQFKISVEEFRIRLQNTLQKDIY